MSAERIAYTRLDPGAFDDFPVANDHLTVEDPDGRGDDEYAIGHYDYESEALFGTPTACDGMYIYHHDSRLFGIVTPAGAFSMVRGAFEQLEDASSVAGLPEITPEQTHALYRDFGTGPHKVKFSETLKAYDRDSRRGSDYDPEQAAEQTAMHSKDVVASPEYIQELIDSAIEDGQYVSSARLDHNGESVTYVAPLCMHTSDTELDDLVAVTRLVNEYFVQ